VAPLTASSFPDAGSDRALYQPPGNGLTSDMTPSHDIMTTARPTSAGLNRLNPSPPKSILASPMATMPPARQIHHGVSGGTDIASSMPVTTAERSPMVCVRLRTAFHANSVATHAPIDEANVMTAGSPMFQIAQAAAGSRAAMTQSMI
jgi:hypothetical protein